RPYSRLNRADLPGDPTIGLGPAVLLEGEDRRSTECAHFEVAVCGDQFIVPRCRHGDDLALRVDDDRVAEQLAAILGAGFGRRDREASVLVAARLDRQMG